MVAATMNDERVKWPECCVHVAEQFFPEAPPAAESESERSAEDAAVEKAYAERIAKHGGGLPFDFFRDGFRAGQAHQRPQVTQRTMTNA
jgi:hypothetical protein